MLSIEHYFQQWQNIYFFSKCMWNIYQNRPYSGPYNKVSVVNEPIGMKSITMTFEQLYVMVKFLENHNLPKLTQTKQNNNNNKKKH